VTVYSTTCTSESLESDVARLSLLRNILLLVWPSSDTVINLTTPEESHLLGKAHYVEKGPPTILSGTITSKSFLHFTHKTVWLLICAKPVPAAI
jgi:hypothetical protein